MITKEVSILNEATLNSLNEVDEVKIVKKFTEAGLKVLEADFGFAWISAPESSEFKLIYKSPGIPFIPNPPRENGRTSKAITKGEPDFVSDTQKTADSQYVSKHIGSFVIIPLIFKDEIYGSMVLCFKKPKAFDALKKTLCIFIQNSVVQALTISRLVVSEKEAQKKALESKSIRKQLQEEKSKLEFIANANHELRTPLAIIKGNVDLALLKSTNTKQALSAIDYEVKHLSSILSDLTLIISQKKQLKDKLSYSQVNLNKLINNTANRLSAIAREKKISINVEQFPEINVLGDEMYLEKLLINLIKNSIRYGNKDGNTNISVSKTKGFVSINVTDDGIGIRKEDLPYIFERFYRGDKSHNSSVDGVGLGLAIVKWVVEVHGGKINVKSTKDKGSTFSVSLPIYPK